MTARGRALLGVAILLGLVTRVAFVLLQSRFRLIEATFDATDAQLYLALARGILEGRGMTLEGHPTAYVTPAYPLFLSLLIRAGADVSGIGLVQAALGAATCAVAAALAWEFATAAGWDERAAETAAIISAFGAALYPHLIFWNGYVLTETLFVFLVALSLYAIVVAARRENAIVAATAGVLAAATALTRPAFLAFAAVIAVWLLARTRTGGRTLIALAFVMGASLPMTAWVARNVADLGAPIITSTESGFVLYAGNTKGGTGGSRGYLDGHDYAPLSLPPGLSEIQTDTAYRNEAMRQILSDPLATIGKWPSKLYNMWRPAYEGASARNLVISLATYIPILALGLIGAALLARGGAMGIGALPALFLAVWATVHVLVAGMIRYRLPAELVLIVTASIAVVWLQRAWSRRFSGSQTGT